MDKRRNGVKRYKIGNMDRYSMAVNGTVMENASFFSIELKEKADPKRLLSAVTAALAWHPLFATRVVYQKQYYLKKNNNPVRIYHYSEADRPKEFGASTNGFPWRLCYHASTLCFEWCHVITDGRGAINFLTTILEEYFGADHGAVPEAFPLDPGFEHFYDKSVKSLGQIPQPAGFRAKDFPAKKNGFCCTSHVLTLQTEELLTLAKAADTTPAALLAPLLSKAIRCCIPESAKNRNVSCGIVVDCRKPMQFETMHNFILNKVITYTDRFDGMDLAVLGTIYRAMLDVFTQEENMIAGCTDMIRQTDFLYRLRPLWLQRAVMKLTARIIKNHMNNFGLTYLGKVPFPKNVADQLVSIDFRSWPDIGNCVAAVIDLNGTLSIDLCENYKDTRVAETFIRICGEYGLNVKEKQTVWFQQASMKIK